MGTIGSNVVVAASGIMMFTKSDGAPFGVQLFTVVHDVLTDPFQVSVSISFALNPSSKVPKVDGKNAILILDNFTQFSVVLILARPCSNKIPGGFR